MQNIIFYFSGTGNSLKAAKTLAKELGDTEIVSMAKSEKFILKKQYDSVGFVYPVYYWGLPRKTVEFISNMDFNNNAAYCYSVATYGGIVGNGIRQTKELLGKHNINLNYGAKLKMVANFIISYNITNNVRKCLRQADKKLVLIIRDIKSKKNNTVNKPFKTVHEIYANSMKNLPLLSKDFNVNKNCTGCGVCRDVCPVKNIEMTDNKPVFKDACEQCLSCMHHCHRKAINYGNKTQKRKRYTHPEIGAKELIEFNKR